MAYRTLRECIEDLQRTGQLVRVEEEIDPCLEAAEIQRRVYQAGGPAVYFANARGCQFPLVSNLFGTLKRARFIFRDSLARLKCMVDLKADPARALKTPLKYTGALRGAWHMRPRWVRTAPVLAHQTTIDRLPQVTSWPDDGGAFITLPQVYTEDPDAPGFARSNLGMYRVQLSGGQYEPSREIGLHYQIHRGIGVHHQAAIRRGESLRVNIFVGGTPAMTLAAVMPLPEGLSEVSLAGALAGRRIPLVRREGGLPIYAEADFCITGTVDPERLLPEGPFGDHLGYYSLAHDFPVLKVDGVYHRPGAIWPFTVVGRPPQEDTTFGQLIHEITGPVIPSVLPGVRAVHAVDASGVHPLLLAIGSERYVPFAPVDRPQELLTQASAILGQGQMSLAKYLMIVAHSDAPDLDIHDIQAFFMHLLSRIDCARDLHFHTRTTIDTLDYSGGSLNAGSKLVMAAVGPTRRELATEVPSDMKMPSGFHEPCVGMPGVLVVGGPAFSGDASATDDVMNLFCGAVSPQLAADGFPLIVVADDAQFTARSLENLLWVTFTRSNPAADVYGVQSFVRQKHWGCRGPLVIDARSKPHHAPPLLEDPRVTRKVDALAARGGPLHGII